MQKFNTQTALIVVDMQNDFMPDGALGVNGANTLIEKINAYAKQFSTVIFTQDWHPKSHCCFAANHNLPEFSTINLDYGEQVLWPVHCVQNTHGAAFCDHLNIKPENTVIQKGQHEHIDSYSAFLAADGKTATGLTDILRKKGITTVYIVGVATDFCVKYTALDAKKAGFKTHVCTNLCKGIDKDGVQKSHAQMRSAGIVVH